MTTPIETTMSAEDHEAAFVEVSFLLGMLAKTVEEVIGNPAPLGVSAGRAMAAKLPLHFKNPDLKAVLEALQPMMKNGMEYTCKVDGIAASLDVGHCVIRDLSAKQGEAPGGRLCKLYHYYLSGIISHLLTKQSRVQETSVGPTCVLSVQSK
jgi:hypothetical protein